MKALKWFAYGVVATVVADAILVLVATVQDEVEQADLNPLEVVQ